MTVPKIYALLMEIPFPKCGICANFDFLLLPEPMWYVTQQQQQQQQQAREKHFWVAANE